MIYSWFIDYMEGVYITVEVCLRALIISNLLCDFYFFNTITGLMRDIYTNEITTPDHCYMLMQPTKFSKEELLYELIVCNDHTFTKISYDSHYLNYVTSWCEPIEIISVECLIRQEKKIFAQRRLD